MGDGILRFSINVMQLIAVLWAGIAAFVALLIVITLFAPQYVVPLLIARESPLLVTSEIPWQSIVLLFFLFLLVLIVPVYLLLFIWHRLSQSSVRENSQNLVYARLRKK
jgi:hypothetical protein